LLEGVHLPSIKSKLSAVDTMKLTLLFSIGNHNKTRIDIHM